MHNKIITERMTAQIDEEVVVFLIGMRINRLWKIHKWLPVALAMPKMINELSKINDSGFLGFESWVGNPSIMIQYWQSFQHLEDYARNKQQKHIPAWRAFNEAVGSNGDVGIWHETYIVKPGTYECVYHNMPPFGLAKATKAVVASGKLASASGRLNNS